MERAIDVMISSSEFITVDFKQSDYNYLIFGLTILPAMKNLVRSIHLLMNSQLRQKRLGGSCHKSEGEIKLSISVFVFTLDQLFPVTGNGLIPTYLIPRIYGQKLSQTHESLHSRCNNILFLQSSHADDDVV
ncbi:unnamed protein product [Sphenostylis stenocarpa]|uniref:Uncharacterized protein n=1 Tax=Sphenostylis stenocarpa TaxID=92480 RepID=A0AA86RTA8_9FABA|nr:unnamed protein product [Sphenostylis stenocarpa]